MNSSELYYAMIFSVFISLLIEEFFGVATGGMITPGVIALNYRNIDILILILVISLLTYLVVEVILDKKMILYGQRKFAMMVMIGLLFKILGDKLYPLLPFAMVGFRGVGAIAPSLLANRYTTQGFVYTIGATGIASFAVHLLLKIALMV